MSITDELRKYAGRLSDEAARKSEHGFSPVAMALEGIADRIDAEHEAACAEAYGNGVMSVPIALDESQWVKLPVDADGEVIHVGDELDVGFVARIVITDDEWPSYLYAYKETPHILTQYFCNEVSHHHEPTVEDVLREFAEKVTDSQVPGVRPTYEEAISEYASRLRLAEGDA